MKEKIINALLEASEEVLGLPVEEMRENLEMNLLDSDLIDSIGFVALLSEVEEEIGKSIDITKLGPDDYKSLMTLANAIELMI